MKPTRMSRLGLILVWTLSASATARAESKPLPRSTPERQGVSSAALLDFVETADSKIDSLHGLVVVRRGHVIAEGWWAPYSAGERHEMYSLSKSFTSTAVGLAVAEGKLSLSDSVLEAFPSDAPSKPDANLKAMRLRDLLRMSVGHAVESVVRDTMTTKTFLAHPVPFKPGTHFLYNTPATFMASAMVQKATGQTVLDYLKPRLFDPLGIENPKWDMNSQGISLGGYGLSIRTEDIAKFGLLYLRKGNWNGKQLIPADWTIEATSIQTSNGSNPKSDWEQGYGYQFWRSRHGAYRGDGAFGQFCVVLPERDTVVAITSGVRDMQGVLNLLWDKLLPALKDDALPENESARRKLTAKLASLSLKKPVGSPTSPKLKEIAGKPFAFPKNDRKIESLTIESNGGDDFEIITRIDGRDERLTVGVVDWKPGILDSVRSGRAKTQAFGRWASDEELKVKFAWVETPFVQTLTFKFEGDKVTFDSESNVRAKDPTLVGKRN